MPQLPLFPQEKQLLGSTSWALSCWCEPTDLGVAMSTSAGAGIPQCGQTPERKAVLQAPP